MDHPVLPQHSETSRSGVSPERPLPINRREVLEGLTFVGAALLTGCGDRRTDDSVDPTAVRTDVPLRILFAGSEDDAESIRLEWSMSMEQGLQIETIDPQTDALDADLESKMKLVDLAILPQRMLGALAKDEISVALSNDLLHKLDSDLGPQLPAVEEGLGHFGSARFGMAAGCKIFAILSVESDVKLESWAAYEQWVAGFVGRAAEPLAEGWAAASYLHRCASSFSRGWLFNRNTMKPEITSEDYVKCLEQLASTTKHYANPSMTPGEVWSGIRSGALRGGIGFDVSAPESEAGEDDREEFDVGAFDCPLETETDRVWFPPQTPMVCLSTGCRQTDASKRFVGWMSGGERTSVFWEQSELFSLTRVRPGSDAIPNESAYRRWLINRLQTRQVVPSLILPGALRYYRALDECVRRCTRGEQAAADALNDASARWEVITDQLGRDSQRIAWKRSLGFGS